MKKIMAILTSIAVVLAMMPTMVFGAKETKCYPRVKVYSTGFDNCVFDSSKGQTSYDNGMITYNNGILTLKNYTGGRIDIYSTSNLPDNGVAVKDIEIVVIGENNITSQSAPAGIYSNCKMKFTGTGTLNIGRSDYYAQSGIQTIYSEIAQNIVDIEIGCNLNIYAEQSGVSAEHGIKITGEEVNIYLLETAKGISINSASNRNNPSVFDVSSDTKVNIFGPASNATITAANACGIYTGHLIKSNINGEVTITSEHPDFVGFRAGSEIKVGNKLVIETGGDDIEFKNMRYSYAEANIDSDSGGLVVGQNGTANLISYNGKAIKNYEDDLRTSTINGTLIAASGNEEISEAPLDGYYKISENCTLLTGTKDETATTADGGNKLDAGTYGETKCIRIAKTDDIVYVESINLDKDEISIYEGSEMQLEATVLPADAVDKTVTWTSSNNNIATVDNTGKVTGVAAGDVTITASIDSITATCEVTVIAKPVGPFSVTWKTQDGSGTIEQDINVESLTMPSFDGDWPTKAPNETNRYAFAGWAESSGQTTGIMADKLPAITEDKIYYAAFTPVSKEASVSFSVEVYGGKAYANNILINTENEKQENTVITIKADEPFQGKAFDRWVSEYAPVEFADATSPETTFTMPFGKVKVFATYKPVSDTPSGNNGGGSSYIPSVPPANPITNDGGNNAAGTAPTTTVDTKPVTTTEGGVKTTTAAVNESTGKSLVDNAVKNESAEVVVDATTSNANASSAAGAKTEVALTENTVKELAEKTSAGLDIKTDNAAVSLDEKAVKEVAKQAGETGEVKLVVETKKADNKEVVIEVSLVTSNGAVTDFGEGNVKVTVPVTSQLKNKTIVCVYIDDEGNYTKMKGQLNDDGTYTFVTNHFSTYAIMEEEAADAKIAEQNKEKVNTLIKEFKFKASTKYTSKKNVKVTAKVLEGDISDITGMGYRVEYTFSRAERKGGIYYKKKTSEDKTYINTAGKKGKKYYYRVQMYVYDGDTLVGKTEMKQSEYGVRTWKKK